MKCLISQSTAQKLYLLLFARILATFITTQGNHTRHNTVSNRFYSKIQHYD